VLIACEAGSCLLKLQKPILRTQLALQTASIRVGSLTAVLDLVLYGAAPVEFLELSWAFQV